MKVLVFAPHPDDEVLGVGGTIKKRVNNGDEVYVCVVTKGYEPLFDDEFIQVGRQECKKANEFLGVKEVIFLDFPAAMLESIPRYELNQKILEVVLKIKPEEIYMPHKGDMQIDHQMIVDAIMVAVRPKYEHKVKRIYAYETLSETGWNIPNVTNEFIPNVYEDISDTISHKIQAMEIYESQICEYPNARSSKAIVALSVYRGTTVNTKYAEAFSLIREIK